ncbi:MAG TPA: ATP-binding protein [Crocinitomicaceae bacterium]|nr:ATP-binding protein [Crocinitomicaceae bacterium]
MEIQQKNKIKELIQTEKQRLGSFAKVAKKCNVSEATISLIRNEKWEDITDEMWLRVGTALNFRPDNWVIAKNTRDYKFVSSLLAKSKDKSMFLIIANEAGTGKTTGLYQFCADNAEQGAFYIQVREWSARTFLQKFMTMLGLNEPKGYKTADELLEIIIESLSEKALMQPIVCIDEADKLKPSALRQLIYLFNALEDRCAFVIAGTENLTKEIERGVKYAKKGYDEIDSRFGRVSFPLIGANKQDVTVICQANGLFSDALIAEIWAEVGTKYKSLNNGKRELVCSDLRRLKRVIQREQLIQKVA